MPFFLIEIKRNNYNALHVINLENRSFCSSLFKILMLDRTEFVSQTAYSDDSLKWRTHLSGALGHFGEVRKTHLSGAPEIRKIELKMCLKYEKMKKNTQKQEGARKF